MGVDNSRHLIYKCRGGVTLMSLKDGCYVRYSMTGNLCYEKAINSKENIRAQSLGFYAGGKMRAIKLLILVVFIVVLFQANMDAKISSRVEGVVTDKDTGIPIEGAKVTLHIGYMRTDYFVTNREIEWETVTNSKGYFRFNIGIPLTRVNEFYVQCSKKDYIPSIPELYKAYSKPEFVKENFRVFKLNEGQIKHLKIELEKGGILKGKIFKKEPSGITPLSYAGGFLKRKSNPDEKRLEEAISGYKIEHIDADEKGEFEIHSIEPYDNYYITFVLNGYPLIDVSDIKVNKYTTEMVEIILDLTDQTGIEGIITVGALPAKSGYIYIIRDVPISQLKKNDISSFDIYENNINGKYSCKGLNPGVYRMSVHVSNGNVRYDKDFIIEIEKGITKVFNIDF